MPALLLHPFDATAVPGGSELRAAVARDGVRLQLRWTLDDPPGAWVFSAAAGAPARRDRLWETTCFEVFVAPAGRPEYWEVNLSPAGDWNVYRFDAYRDGMRPEPRIAAPSVDTATDPAGRFTLAATLDLTPIAELTDVPLEVSVTAVVEAPSGGRSYWAVRHARSQPDFHARASFVVRLDP